MTEAGAILEVERLGGLAGFGAGGSRIRSRGRCDLSTLPQQDRTIIDGLFGMPHQGTTAGGDRFGIRLTRRTSAGAQMAVVPEAAVPLRVLACLRDELI